ncbi:MAG: CinA family nicotinamide mononucleotide deamidase-related protein [Peptococcaceae bacterium]|nr:CinA family nicotinamide mononucleotide deamidase-related protein [Peptococcaceae bacterium]
MKSEVIFTGTELIIGQSLNTNAQYLQQTLAALGIDLYYQVTVGDNQKRLAEAILQASARADLVIIGGGLGPTEDDVSREALAEALGVPLVENPEARLITERFFKSRGVEMSPNNIKQTLAPPSGIILDNPVGTAPGLALEHNSKLYVLLPGPPGEFRTMIDSQVVPLLRKRLGPDVSIIKSRVLKLCGIGESKVDQTLGRLLRGKNPTLAPTAKFSEVYLRITAKASSNDEADLMIDGMDRKVRELLGDYIYGTDDETLPEVVGKMLAAKKLKMAAAETCSGGYLSHLITSFPRGAQSFKLALISDFEGMEGFLKIPVRSRENPARVLASAVRELAAADIGIAITENTGGLYPSGQSDITIATSFKDSILAKTIKLWGEGEELRQRAVQVCLVLLWNTLRKI